MVYKKSINITTWRQAGRYTDNKTAYLLEDKNSKRELLTYEKRDEIVDEDAEVAPPVPERDDDGGPVFGSAVGRRVVSPWPQRRPQLPLQLCHRLVHVHQGQPAHWTQNELNDMCV